MRTMFGIFLDTETNGLDYKKHRLLEIAFKIVDLLSGEIEDQYESIIFQSQETWERSDPASIKVNGFCLEDLKTGKTEKKIKSEIIEVFNLNGITRKTSVFICQNPSFDRVFFSQLIDTETQERLRWPYHWLDLASMFWAVKLLKTKDKRDYYPWEIGLSKDAIASSFKLPPEEKPHRAMNGVNHLLLCYTTILGFPKQ